MGSKQQRQQLRLVSYFRDRHDAGRGEKRVHSPLQRLPPISRTESPHRPSGPRGGHRCFLRQSAQRIDTLINNAGVFIAKPFTQYSEGDYAVVLGVNRAGFFHMTQLAIAEMEKRSSGHIVQITTSLIDHANSHVPSVFASLTKGGLDAATRSLAIEYAKRGIRVNAVAPGVIKTQVRT
jgi:NAD(P)-dependent dehydrogenase (short-subunit alcohol dehydrogenase family)